MKPSGIRLRQICLAARKLAPVVDDVRAVFGLEVCHRDPSVAAFGLENALLPAGNQFLEVVAPVQADTAAGRYLERLGGDCGYMVILQAEDHDAHKRRIAELGVRVAFAFENDTYHCMQLHPKDTGGAFLEVDWHAGWERHDGPWWPAGPEWAAARRTDLVRGILAAELESPTPDRLAHRWSEILGVPACPWPDGGYEIPLRDATLRFVEGQPERLASVELAAVDRNRILASARSRALPTSDEWVRIGGVRFLLGA